jgi:hypothetical protein
VEQVATVLVFTELSPHFLRPQRVVKDLEGAMDAEGPSQRPVHARTTEADDAAAVATPQGSVPRADDGVHAAATARACSSMHSLSSRATRSSLARSLFHHPCRLYWVLRLAHHRIRSALAARLVDQSLLLHLQAEHAD